MTAPVKKTAAQTVTKKAVKAAKAATVTEGLEPTEAAAKKATAAKPAKGAAAVLQISRLQTETIIVPILGTAPLVVHRFSEKAKKQMLDAMQGVKRVRENKDPHAEFMGAFYRFADGRYGFPSIGFKSCMVDAARFYHGVTMTLLKQVIFVSGKFGVDNVSLTEILGDAEVVEFKEDPDEDPNIIMREDVVRVGQGGTDLRYRPQFTNWRATLTIKYVTSQLSRESVLSLLDAGGMGVGVGEWRPERSGEMGTFTIDEDRELIVIQ